MHHSLLDFNLSFFLSSNLLAKNFTFKIKKLVCPRFEHHSLHIYNAIFLYQPITKLNSEDILIYHFICFFFWKIKLYISIFVLLPKNRIKFVWYHKKKWRVKKNKTVKSLVSIPHELFISLVNFGFFFFLNLI
jgi:hypothetical protein